MVRERRGGCQKYQQREDRGHTQFVSRVEIMTKVIIPHVVAAPRRHEPQLITSRHRKTSCNAHDHLRFVAYATFHVHPHQLTLTVVQCNSLGKVLTWSQAVGVQGVQVGPLLDELLND